MVQNDINSSIPPADKMEATYCQALLKGQDPDHWYALRYNDPMMHNPLIAIYAWQVELRQVIQSVREPGLGEIRLQWWREAFEEIATEQSVRHHPVVLALATTLTPLPDQIKTLGLTMERNISARARLLYDAPFETIEDFFQWALAAEGAIDEMAASIVQPAFDRGTDIRQLGALLAMVRDGARLAPHLDPSLVTTFAKEQSCVLRKNFKSIDPTMMAVILPFSLIPLYAKYYDHPKKILLRRHLKLLSTVVRGHL